MANVDIGPYNRASSVTKSDTVDFDLYTLLGPCHALYVGGAGIVVGVFPDGSTAQFTAVAGQVLTLALRRVNSTTTTATLMVALYQV